MCGCTVHTYAYVSISLSLNIYIYIYVFLSLSIYMYICARVQGSPPPLPAMHIPPPVGWGGMGRWAGSNEGGGRGGESNVSNPLNRVKGPHSWSCPPPSPPCGMWGGGAHGIRHAYNSLCMHAMHAYVGAYMPCMHMPTCIRHACICRIIVDVSMQVYIY